MSGLKMSLLTSKEVATAKKIFNEFFGGYEPMTIQNNIVHSLYHIIRTDEGEMNKDAMNGFYLLVELNNLLLFINDHEKAHTVSERKN